MHDSRIARLLDRMEAEELDALLVHSLPNIFYLSAFTGTTALLLITPQQRWVITDFRYLGRVESESRGGWTVADNSSRRLAEVLAELPNSACLRRIGVEAAHTSLAQHGSLSAELATSLPESRLVQTDGWVEELRAVKDADEIERLRAAVRLGERMFAELLGCIGPDTTEADLAAEHEYRLRKHGASAASFKPIIASGTRSCLPHAGYTNARLTPGAPLTLDIGVVLDGYCSDMTRTVFCKDCPEQWRAIYETVRLAKQAGFAAIRPGATGRFADSAARDVIAAAGHGEHFGHGLGHGVGIQIHEEPRLTQANTAPLVSGNVVSCEPGIYLPGVGGVRIEDLVYVTDTGAASFNELADELTVTG